MSRPMFLLIALVGCSDFGSDELTIRVPDVRADLVDRDGFVSQVLDLDGDGLNDLVTFQGNTDALSVSRGLAEGGFDSVESWNLPADVRMIRDRFAWGSMGDMNGDGVADILAAEPNGDNLDFTFYRGTGSGFDPGTNYGSLPSDGELGDVDGDGVADWIRRGDSAAADYVSFGESGAWYWEVWLGGATNFASTATEWAVPAKYTLAVGDWNTDGIPDALGWNGTASDPTLPVELEDGTTAFRLYRGTRSGFASNATNWSAPSDLSAEVGSRYRAVDVTCDGEKDLVRRLDRDGEWIGGVEMYVNTGDGFSGSSRLNFHAPEGFTGTVRPLLLDVTGDGCRDLVYTTTDGTGTFGGEVDPHWLVFEG